MLHLDLRELAAIYLGSAVAMLISAFLLESVKTRYIIGCLLLFLAIVIFIAA